VCRQRLPKPSRKERLLALTTQTILCRERRSKSRSVSDSVGKMSIAPRHASRSALARRAASRPILLPRSTFAPFPQDDPGVLAAHTAGGQRHSAVAAIRRSKFWTSGHNAPLQSPANLSSKRSAIVSDANCQAAVDASSSNQSADRVHSQLQAALRRRRAFGPDYFVATVPLMPSPATARHRRAGTTAISSFLLPLLFVSSLADLLLLVFARWLCGFGERYVGDRQLGE
jgi:hypothetical protein